MGEKTIYAKKGKQVKTFPISQWKEMPKHKYGWRPYIPEVEAKTEPAVETTTTDTGKKPEDIIKSVDLDGGVKAVILKLKEMDDVDAINAFVEGDDRKTVTDAVKKRIAELSE